MEISRNRTLARKRWLDILKLHHIINKFRSLYLLREPGQVVMTGRRKPWQEQKPPKNLENAVKNNFYCKKSILIKNDKEPEDQKSSKDESLEARNFRQKSNFIFTCLRNTKKLNFENKECKRWQQTRRSETKVWESSVAPPSLPGTPYNSRLSQNHVHILVQ